MKRGAIHVDVRFYVLLTDSRDFQTSLQTISCYVPNMWKTNSGKSPILHTFSAVNVLKTVIVAPIETTSRIICIFILYLYGSKGFNKAWNVLNCAIDDGQYVTSICILRCVLKWESSVRKMESESSKTSGTEETPFLDRATQRYCLMALMNISLVLKMGPAFCRMDRSSWRDRTFDRSSWDLRRKKKNQVRCLRSEKTNTNKSAALKGGILSVKVFVYSDIDPQT